MVHGEEIRFHIDAHGAEVMEGGRWYPADGKVLENVVTQMKAGLLEGPESRRPQKARITRRGMRNAKRRAAVKG